jgi:hypothetical protein
VGNEERPWLEVSLLIKVPTIPQRKPNGMETMPGLRSGNQDQSAFVNIDAGGQPVRAYRSVRRV